MLLVSASYGRRRSHSVRLAELQQSVQSDRLHRLRYDCVGSGGLEYRHVLFHGVSCEADDQVGESRLSQFGRCFLAVLIINQVRRKVRRV